LALTRAASDAPLLSQSAALKPQGRNVDGISRRLLCAQMGASVRRIGVSAPPFWLFSYDYGIKLRSPFDGPHDALAHSRSVHFGTTSVGRCTEREHQIARNEWLKPLVAEDRVKCNRLGLWHDFRPSSC
jgi:hypothetical protein